MLQKDTCFWSELSLSIGDENILKNINGHVSSGSVSALTGPSGSGKSSLLNVLAGRVLPSRRTKISGDILVNDRKIKTVQFRQNLAYVMQEDLLYATATAREAIEFSAHLRLPKVISRNPAKTKQIVDDLLDSLGLSHVHDTMVGSEKLRGLSGGEKKRVAIGVELVTNPSLLFLDEPTSGLDSFSARKVVKILKALGSATGCAIVCSIHQPNSEIFQSFDSVTVLSEGRVMYGGTVTEMPKILKGLGKSIPEMTNSADFILLLAQTSSDDKNFFSYNLDKSVSKSPDVLKNEIAGQHLCDESKDSVGAMQQSLHLAKRKLLSLKRDYMTLLVGGSLSFTVKNLHLSSCRMEQSCPNPGELHLETQSTIGCILQDGFCSNLSKRPQKMMSYWAL